MRRNDFPAEWHLQSGVQLTWPHEKTDWASILDEVIPCFVSIAREIIKHEIVLIVCKDAAEVRRQLGEVDESRLRLVEMPTNDTWARDHGGLSLPGSPNVMYDFVFNGWGMKFSADKDNQITRRLFEAGVFSPEIERVDMSPFVLEGGNIESNGKGTLMLSGKCMLAPNRNGHLSEEAQKEYICSVFGAEHILWLHHGDLIGDDTDGHIDTLARFCAEDTIAYVQCTDKEDAHYEELRLMEKELETFRQKNGEPFRLVPIPMADKVEWEGERLPATYANFLIINGAVLLPFYDSPKDEAARKILQELFPDREVVGINCLPLIKQHGSLHCVTMQYPEEYIV